MFKRISLLAIAPVAVALVIAGCGGGSSGSSTAAMTSSSSSFSFGGQGQLLKLTADPSGQLRFDTAKLTAKPGKRANMMAPLSWAAEKTPPRSVSPA